MNEDMRLLTQFLMIDISTSNKPLSLKSYSIGVRYRYEKITVSYAILLRNFAVIITPLYFNKNKIKLETSIVMNA